MRVRDVLQRAVGNDPCLNPCLQISCERCVTLSVVLSRVSREALGCWLAAAALVLFGLSRRMVESAPWRAVNREHPQAWSK